MFAVFYFDIKITYQYDLNRIRDILYTFSKLATYYNYKSQF